jgi:uncharacterized membrane protein YeaQ/YmgE (transglycosylase-associated protein family)
LVIRLNQKEIILIIGGFIAGFVAMHLMHTQKLFGMSMGY